MPTIRSHYNIAQFNEVLQKFAHKLALDAVTNLNKGSVRITIDGPEFSNVETDEYTVKFYVSHVNVVYHGKHYEDHWGFDAEKKDYLTSNHSTKLSFWCAKIDEDPVRKKAEKKITAFVEKLMADAGIQPVPRFALKNLAH